MMDEDKAAMATEIVKFKLTVDEELIEEIRKRPPLWNFKLPLSERSQHIKKVLWAEVYETLNRIMTVEEMKKKWKSLIDSFRIHSRKDPNKLSMTGRSKPWVHLERMQFLKDVQQEGCTVSKMHAYANDDDAVIDESIDSDTPLDTSSNDIRHGSQINKGQLIDNMKPIIVSVPQFQTPVPPVISKCDLIGQLIAAQLKELDPSLVDTVTIQLLQVISDAKN